MRDSKPSFSGRWLVSEYVYTPHGEFVGIVRQQRWVELTDAPDRLQIIQICEPVVRQLKISSDAQTVADVMDRRTGEFVFDLFVDGQSRHYLGPDVVGGGFSWKDGVLTARGMWPNFGFNFASFSILTTSTRQVTGGRFYQANREICTIVGVAAPVTQGYPSFSHTEIHQGMWQGKQDSIAPDGSNIRSETVTWADISAVEEQVSGCAHSYGVLHEVEGTMAPGKHLSAMRVTDHQAGILTGVHRVYVDEQLAQFNVFIMGGAQ
jgi:hypothetical protein